MMLVKLGGSVITDKSALKSFKRAACERLATELLPARKSLMLVHGAGSYGHIEAKEHKLHKGYLDDSQLEHVAKVQRDVRELNLKVIEALIGKGLRAASIPPAASATFKGGAMRAFQKSAFSSILDLGLVPVSFGDVVPDETMGFSVCSGDLIMEALAKSFEPETVIFCADVDGVFDRDPKRSRNAVLISQLTASSIRRLRPSETKHADVTGSIYGKLERMLAISHHCEKCMIVNGNVPGRLEKAVRGDEVVSTVVLPG